MAFRNQKNSKLQTNERAILMNTRQDSPFYKHIKSYQNGRSASFPMLTTHVYNVPVTYSASCNNKHTVFVGVQSQTDKIEFITN